MKEMTCGEFEEVVHGFVHMELLDVNVREAALEHAAHCALCSERMADAAVLAEELEILGQNGRTEQTPPHVEAALGAAFRSHHRDVSWRRKMEWIGVGVAAAVLILLLWSGNGSSNNQMNSAPGEDLLAQSATPVQGKASEPLKQDAGVQESSAANLVADASGSESYTASDFVPVPYTGTIAADDPGMVVRVQLTRDSLAQLGYPVAETPDEDLILADVLVGEDGWPRGVKLIQ